MIVVDAWLMYKNSRTQDDINNNRYIRLKDFTTEIALQLCSMDNEEKDFYPGTLPEVKETKSGVKRRQTDYGEEDTKSKKKIRTLWTRRKKKN